MKTDRPRTVEVRLIVIVDVDVTHDELVHAVKDADGKRVSDLVSSEIVSNLKSVPYVQSAIASPL
jgi:hypothetical protein